MRAQEAPDLLGERGQFRVAAERQDGHLGGGDARVELEQRAVVALLVGLHGVGIDEEGERRAVDAGGRLDDVRHDVLVAVVVEVGQALAAVLGVRLEVEVGAVGDALELVPAPGEAVLQVGGAGGVVGELLGRMDVAPEVGRIDAQVEVPLLAQVDPALVPLGGVARLHEELHLHLLELAGAEGEVARRDLVAEGLADLRDAEGQATARGGEHVLEVDEDALGGLGAQEGGRAGILHGADVGLEHEVELARRGHRAGCAAAGAEAVAGELILAEALLALPAIDERVGEVLEVAAGLPHLRRHEDGGIEAHDVGALAHHGAPPLLLDVALQLDAHGAVVPGGGEAAVDLAAGEHEAAPLGQRHDGVEGGAGGVGRGRVGHGYSQAHRGAGGDYDEPRAGAPDHGIAGPEWAQRTS